MIQPPDKYYKVHFYYDKSGDTASIVVCKQTQDGLYEWSCHSQSWHRWPWDEPDVSFAGVTGVAVPINKQYAEFLTAIMPEGIREELGTILASGLAHILKGV